MPARTALVALDVCMSRGVGALMVESLRIGQCRCEDGGDFLGLDEKGVVSDGGLEMNEPRGCGETVGERGDLLEWHDGVALSGDECRRGGDTRRIDSMEIATERQGEKAVRAHSCGKRVAAVPQIVVHREPCVV